MTSSDDALVITRVVNGLGRIELNKAKAINALGRDMVASIDSALNEWRDDDAVAAVLITGRGDRGLCAGGDIKAIYQDLVAGTSESQDFWAEEYRMNFDIAGYPKPYIAIMHGITMGGGVGVSVHGSHRVVTETTKLGMPETGIGLFPDIGGTYLLAQTPGEIGMYMGLTGLPIGPGAALAYGLADTFVLQEKVEELISALEADGTKAVETLASFAGEAPANELAEAEAWINTCFAHDSVEAILAALLAHGDEDAAKTAEVIKAKSPRSLAVTFEMIRTAKTMTLQEVLERDFRAGTEIAARPDLREGIRAQVIDKDRNPQWNPATLGEVEQAEVDAILNTEQDRKVFS